MTVPDPVRRWAGACPDAPALVAGVETWTWADLDARVGACATRITGEGPLAVQAVTSPALVVLVLAALRAGRLLVPLSTRWTDDAIRLALDDLGTDRLVQDRPGLDGVDTLVLADVTRAGDRGEAEPLGLDRPFTVVHTSGSTGRPKAIVHSVGNHVWSARGVIDALGLRAGDRWLLDLPLYHVGGLGVVMRCVMAGAAMAVPSPAMPLAERIDRLRPTHASFVATQLRRLLDADTDLSNLRAVLLGGSAISEALIDRALGAGVPLVTSYGMTEMAATVTATRLPPDRADLVTSGWTLPHRALRIAESGEIEVSGPTRFLGWRSREGIVPAPEWHATGDLGNLDEQGRLVVTGRRDLMFVSGGENVHPEAIESALLAIDEVAEAVVVPVSDAEFGARPAAFVRAEGVDPEEIRTALRATLPGFAVPVAVHAWAGAEGLKPDRPALAREAERREAETGKGEAR